MAEHLSALDATFLELEQGDPSAHMHIGGLLTFDPRADGSIPTVEELTAHWNPRRGADHPPGRQAGRPAALPPAAFGPEGPRSALPELGARAGPRPARPRQ